MVERVERVFITAAGRKALMEAQKPKCGFRRYPDGCYAVVIGKLRGPCGNSKRRALARYLHSGLIASARSGG
jgi:hypothetical protein